VKRDYTKEMLLRTAWLKDVLAASGAFGFVFGSSGGKDSALVGILCKAACENTLGVIMPCGASINFGDDKAHALLLAKQYGIEHAEVDLTNVKSELVQTIGVDLNDQAERNVAPRLRMTTLYAIAANQGRLVVGTGNKSENYVGYFTKWGDGDYDLNPIADLTATEVHEFLEHINAPKEIWTKAPSAGLFEGQTDEAELGFSYKELDEYLLYGKEGENIEKIKKQHKNSEHKRKEIPKFKSPASILQGSALS